ncbi:MAG: hypothetical protein Q7R41_01030, partial [Phycisphaerales bacterium]|nr:hypothetical protein [Phycisphaerales bacterium]
GDTLRYLSRIVYTGRTSIAVEIKIERIGQGKNVLDLSNDCVFTFVNVDHELRPQPVPAVYPTTYKEDARYLAAFRRSRAHVALKTLQAEAVFNAVAP